MLAAMGNAAQGSTSLALQPTVRWPPKDGQPSLTMRGRRIPAFDHVPLLKCRAQPSRQMLMRIGSQPSHASRWYLCAPTFEVSRRHRLAGGCRLDRRVGAHVFDGCIIAPSAELAKCFLCVSNAPQRCAKHQQPRLTSMLGERGVGCSGSRCSYYPSSHCAGAGG